MKLTNAKHHGLDFSAQLSVLFCLLLVDHTYLLVAAGQRGFIVLNVAVFGSDGLEVLQTDGASVLVLLLQLDDQFVVEFHLAAQLQQCRKLA